jgi:hypothetical protein
LSTEQTAHTEWAAANPHAFFTLRPSARAVRLHFKKAIDFKENI